MKNGKNVINAATFLLVSCLMLTPVITCAAMPEIPQQGELQGDKNLTSLKKQAEETEKNGDANATAEQAQKDMTQQLPESATTAQPLKKQQGFSLLMSLDAS